MDAFVVAEKDRLLKLAPTPEVMKILLLRYDYSNLKLISKALAAGETREKILAQCWQLGTIHPDTLLSAVTTDTLFQISPQLSSCLAQATENNTRSTSEFFDVAYLQQARIIAKKVRDSFVTSYVETIIDLYNLQMRLRSFVHHASETIIVRGEFVAGGTIDSTEIDSLEAVTKNLLLLGNKRQWQEAISAFTNSHDFTAIDLVMDNYLAEFLKKATIDPHTPSSLFAYFLSMLEHTQFVRTVISAHNVGLSEVELRNLVRNSIHDYAY